MTVDGRKRKPIIRLLSVASSFKNLLPPLGCRNAKELIQLVQESVGERYRVTGNCTQIEAVEDDHRGGRRDDLSRAREIQSTFANDDIAAAIALRGGAWLTRILPRIDFDVLSRRRNRLALFGFSELTPLINIAAGYKKVFAYHDLCPGFLLAGMTNYARDHIGELTDGTAPAGRPHPGTESADVFAREWATARFPAEFSGFFKDAVTIIEGRGSKRSVSGVCVRGRITEPRQIRVVGGNLTTLVTLLASPYAAALRPKGRWLLIEDIRESPERVDRLLSHLSLSGWLNQYEGILVGRFYRREGDCTRDVLACLDRHLGGRGGPPVVVTEDVGHVWPISPLPIARPFDLVPLRSPRGRGRLAARFPWSRWRIV